MLNFCTYYGLDMFPVDMLQERRYIQYLSEFHKSVNSSKNYISGMRALHALHCMLSIPPKEWLYNFTVNGIRREKTHVVKQASPMTPQLCASLSYVVNIHDGTQLAVWVLILFGFYLLFLKSNLVSDSILILKSNCHCRIS